MYGREDSADNGAAEQDGLPEPRPRAEVRVFQSLTVSAARTLVSRQADEAGMDPVRRNDLILAVSELATNSVRHAEGWGTVRVWRERDALVCEVADKGRLDCEVPAPRPGVDQVNGYGLWLAGQLCERVHVRSSASGTVVRLQMPV